MPQVELTQFRETYGADAAHTAGHTQEELVLIDRLVSRQGVSRAEADLLVERHKQGQRAEIDPALMEGLDTL
ncbi:MAG: hypothetical protein ABI740_04335 [Alphaproteobacteria bacterium]